MTAQQPDVLLLDGERWHLLATPLWDWLAAHGYVGVPTSTGNWRGHVATWQVAGDRLLLVAATGQIRIAPASADGPAGPPSPPVPRDLDLDELFGRPPPIEATWVSGVLRIVRGAVVEYVHMGFESAWEDERLVLVDGGVVTAVVDRPGTPPEPPPAAPRRG